MAYITFPKPMEKAEVGLLKSFVKMFSPLLDADVYAEETVAKTKRTPLRKLRSGNYIYTSNSTDANATEEEEEESVLLYSEETNYSYVQEGDNTVLENQAQIQSSADTHNSVESTAEQSTFEGGELKQTKLNSNTDFTSVQQEPQPNQQSFDLGLNFNSDQDAEMQLLEKFETTLDSLNKFNYVIAEYTEKNLTHTMTMEELALYVMDASDGKELNGTSRLLLNRDGSLTLLEYGKDVKILETNVIGFQVKAMGYTELSLRLYEDPANTYKKTPKFFSEAGTILVLGTRSKKVKLASLDKELPPLTLRFTLDKIEAVMDLLKGDFIARVKEIDDLIASGDFEDNLVPNILNTVGLIMEARSTIVSEEETNSPISIINRILQYSGSIEAVLRTNGQSLLDPKSQFTELLFGELTEFIGEGFADSLKAFL